MVFIDVITTMFIRYTSLSNLRVRKIRSDVIDVVVRSKRSTLLGRAINNGIMKIHLLNISWSR